MNETTIAAISTAYGEAGIGIVRMSGPESLDVLRKVFVPAAGAKMPGDGAAAGVAGGAGKPCGNGNATGSQLQNTGSGDGWTPQPRHMYFGRIVDPSDGSVVDECLAVFSRSMDELGE